MLYSVHDDLHTIVTGSSPEPLIAEASAEIMEYRLPNGEPFIKLWDLLWKYVDHGLTAPCATGELIGHALSISAMDRAINRLPNATVCELKYQTRVTVTDYYKALLTDEAWEELRHSTPANGAQLSSASANKTFADVFKSGYFHFSHYGQANDDAKYRCLGILATGDSNCVSAESGAYGSHDSYPLSSSWWCISKNHFCEF